MKLKDLIGQQFGRLTVMKRGPNRKDKVTWWCTCSCGNKSVLVGTSKLTTGWSTSCGCKRDESIRERSVTHGLTPLNGHVPEYHIWIGMKDRCYNPKNERYERYGARGIYVDALWVNDFGRFYADMGPRPTPKHTLGRENNDGIYSPENCRWETEKQQVRNKSSNVVLSALGETKTMIEWSEDSRCVVSYATLQARIRNYGWDLEKALITPIRG